VPQARQKWCPVVTSRQTQVARLRFSVTSRTASTGTFQWRKPARPQVEQLHSRKSASSASTSSRILPQWQDRA
jgi:hypothetical protein